MAGHKVSNSQAEPEKHALGRFGAVYYTPVHVHSVLAPGRVDDVV